MMCTPEKSVALIQSIYANNKNPVRPYDVYGYLSSEFTTRNAFLCGYPVSAFLFLNFVNEMVI